MVLSEHDLGFIDHCLGVTDHFWSRLSGLTGQGPSFTDHCLGFSGEGLVKVTTQGGCAYRVDDVTWSGGASLMM